MTEVSTQAPATPAAAIAATGLKRGTEVMTLTGIRPVESLHEGDRIVTRTGACPLRGVIRTANRGFKLMFDRPQVVYLENGQIHSDTCQPVAA